MLISHFYSSLTTNTAPSGEDYQYDILLNVKRRLTLLGRHVFSAMLSITQKIDHRKVPWIIASQHGDSERMLRLFEALSENEVFSPIDFSLSVHNAIYGMFSIISKNKLMHTATSSGRDSFETGMIEAYALSNSQKGPVIYLYYDAPMPEIYNEFTTFPQDTVIIGMVLDVHGPGVPLKISVIDSKEHQDNNKQPSYEHLKHLISIGNLPITLKHNVRGYSFCHEG